VGRREEIEKRGREGRVRNFLFACVFVITTNLCVLHMYVPLLLEQSMYVCTNSHVGAFMVRKEWVCTTPGPSTQATSRALCQREIAK
jgi:hypothetical protein